jgi:hypothetical protein
MVDPREAIYNLCGNHDRSAPHEPPAMWRNRWVDPLGENTVESGVNAERRPYPIDGTWERYSFRVGNILFLVMSDVNEPTQSIGRGELGGNPGGVVTGETFRWWSEMVLANPDCIIITAHHYVLKEATVASGLWEGMRRTEEGGGRTHYHGYHQKGTPQGASFLYWVDSVEDSGAFENFLEANPGAVDLWLAGHTHPDDTYGGKSHIETKWGGTHFCNVSSLTRHHVKWSVPKSRVLTFTEGSPDVMVRCYMHTDEFKPQGWYEEDARLLTLSRPFTLDHT